ncbi:pollen receptor-like kinase 3 [Eucalyptus grandis]|uniref:pollen receptor-like kinase 3 n=1 Tax=Eucalyptus grandis TaxID=71139 RepID=UPI00192EF9E7|nr:pollen receptor-like kinase 3 [Eucalyptus grandis]
MVAARLIGPSLVVLSIVLILPPTTYSMSQSDALLKLKRSFANSQALESWVPSSDPCGNEDSWVGVVCYNGIVTGLRLGKMSLSGKVDVDALTEITGLRSLSFVNNSFSGPIPEFNRLGALKAIYISGNQFSGEIPADYFSNMGSLKKLWLSDNKFTGTIPSSAARLTHLIELHLENNEFSGAIPSFDAPALVSLDLSNNQLEGKIPPSLSKFDASSFEGNSGLCGEKIGKECPKEVEQPPTAPNATSAVGPSNDRGSGNDQHNGSADSRKKIIVIIFALGVVLLIIVVCLVIRMRRRAKVQQDFNVLGKENVNDPIQKDILGTEKKEVQLSRKGMGSSRKSPATVAAKGSATSDLVLLSDEKGVFGMADLMKAAAEVLGNGGLGSSYKAVMANGVTVVAKRIRETADGKSKDEFDAEMRKLGRLKHPNVLTPLAYHYRKDEKLLVCEYVPKGSLLYALHGDRGPSHGDLNWPVRLKIIKGVAKGIGFLHDELSSSSLPHGNLKSSNILLNSEYEPLLADYGFSSLLGTSHVPQALFACKAPEVARFGGLSPKCDVYCLGVVILEMLTGKFPSQYLSNGKGGTDVIEWVRSAISDGREAELFDPEIANSTNSFPEMEKLLHIGAACTEANPEQRLDMREAIRRIEEMQMEEGAESRTIDVSPRFHVLSLQEGYSANSG